MKIVEKYINNCKNDELIFLEDIREFAIQFLSCKKDKAFKIVESEILKLKRKNIIKNIQKGIYVKSFLDNFVQKDKLICAKYLEDTFGNVKGYITGEKLLFDLGLTEKKPKIIEIVNNDCKIARFDSVLNVILKPAKIQVNINNFKYLQLFEIIQNLDLDEFSKENLFLANYIFENNLEFEKILLFARLLDDRVSVDKLIILCNYISVNKISIKYL